MLPVLPPALLALADGTVFTGHSIGAAGTTVGEVVFNTALTGYQEILTDPSYCRQIVTLTYPHIGNTGVNAEDIEATRVHAAGLVVKDLPLRSSNFRQSATLPQYLQRENVVAIAGIDTRRLTRALRTRGAQNGCIATFAAGTRVAASDIAAAVERARAAPSMAGLDLAQVVSVNEPYGWSDTEWRLGSGYGQAGAARFHVVAFDYRRQAQHPAHAGRPRLPRHRDAGAHLGRRSDGAQARRHLPEQWPGRSGALQLCDRGHARR